MPGLIQFNGCSTCSLKLEWPNLSHPQMAMTYPEQNSPYRVLVIGESPNAQEDLEGKQFVGKSGKYLRDFIPADWRLKLHFQNCCRCRTPDNRAVTEREVQCCSTYLKEDILKIRPHAILGIGDNALNVFWPDAPQISKIRGIPFPVIVGDHVAWFQSSFHPSYVMHAEREDWTDGSTVNTALPIFKNDLRSFFKRVEGQFLTPPQISFPQRKVLYPETKQEALNLFWQLKEPYAKDYETTKLKPYHSDAKLLCASFSDGDITFAFPVDWPGVTTETSKYRWGKEALQEMVEARREWVAQHAGMELLWTWWITKVNNNRAHDTEVIARLLHKRHGLGSLDVLSRIYFGIDIKKLTNHKLAGQGLGPLDKARLQEYSLKDILEYNGLDSWAEIVLFHQMKKMMTPDDIGNYGRIMRTIRANVAMEVNGLHVDLVESEKLQKALQIKCREFERQAAAIEEVKLFEKKESKIFSLGSAQTLGYVLANYCHIQLPVSESKHYITDADTLEEVAKTHPHPLLLLKVQHKEHQQQNSTFVEPIISGKILGVDGKVHSEYTAIHTRTFRLSSHDPNMQNFPKRKHREVRRQFVAPPGYIFAAFDYGQLEGRVIAMFSKDQNLKKAFVTDDDIHWKWLHRIVDCYPEYMDRLKAKTGETDEKAILKGGRTIIKTDFVFASFYGSVAKSIANRTGIPLRIVETILGEFWNEYSATRTWVDNQFRLYERTGEVKSLTNRTRNEILPGNEITNTPVQGSAAEIVLEAQSALCEIALDQGEIDLLPRINVHDDLLFALPDNDNLESNLVRIGEEIVKPRFSFITVPLMTECRVGYNWCDLAAVNKFSGAYFN